MLYEFRVYWKNIMFPCHYGFSADDLNDANKQLKMRLEKDSDNGTFKVERIEFIC